MDLCLSLIVNENAPVFGRGFLFSFLSIENDAELMRDAYVFWIELVAGLWGLTGMISGRRVAL